MEEKIAELKAKAFDLIRQRDYLNAVLQKTLEELATLERQEAEKPKVEQAWVAHELFFLISRTELDDSISQ